MYTDVGGEIKSWAIAVVVLITILSAIAGVVMLYALLGTGALWFLGLVLGGGVGYFFGRSAAIFMYAFGELVESTDAIRELLHTKSTTGQAPAAGKQTPPPVEKTTVWYCRECGERHEKGEYMCNNCKTVR